MGIVETSNYLYKQMNRKIFNNELPIIPVELGQGNTWAAAAKSINGTPTRIVIDIDNIQYKGEDATPENVFVHFVAILLHEMIHVYCNIKGIPHFDHETKRHLPGFIKAADEHGLIYDDDITGDGGLGNFNMLMWDIEEILDLQEGGPTC